MPVYASSGKGVLSFSPLNLTQLQEVVELVDPLDILACNVGVALYDDMSARVVIHQQLAVNLFGACDRTQAVTIAQFFRAP